MKAGATKDRPENTLLFFFLAFFGVAFSPRYPKRSDGIYNTSIACPLDIISRETLGGRDGEKRSWMRWSATPKKKKKKKENISHESLSLPAPSPAEIRVDQPVYCE